MCDTIHLGWRRVVIYGSRPDGHAKVLVDLLSHSSLFVITGLVDDYKEHAGRSVRNLAVVGSGDDLDRLRAEGVEGVLMGFGETVGRLEVIERVRAAELDLPVFVHPSAHVSHSAAWYDDGAQVLVGAYVGLDARVGARAPSSTPTP